jgi:hypothetical protein
MEEEMIAECDWCEERKEIAVKATACNADGEILHAVLICKDCVKQEMRSHGAFSSTIRVGFDVGTEVIK